MTLSLNQPSTDVAQPEVTIQQLLFSAKYQLAVVAEDSLLEAEILLGLTLKKPRSYLHSWPNDKLNQSQIEEFLGYIARRLNNEPIAYITGKREFWSLDLSVNFDTLIPRPETELLVEITLEIFKETNLPIKVADLGTGSGAIALALAHEKPSWKIYATDASEKALEVAAENAQKLNLKNINFYQGHWCSALPESDFDIIISNPPYLSETEWETYASGLTFEPRGALVSGSNGLEAIQTILSSSKNYLKPSGYVLVEHGFLQGSAVRKIFAGADYGKIRSVRDLSGQERATLGQVC